MNACDHCSDTGWVSIWSGESLAKLREGELDRRNVRRIAVACCCRAGDRYAKTTKGMRFNPEKMLAWVGADDDAIEKAHEFLERQRLSRQANYAFNPDNYEYPGTF